MRTGSVGNRSAEDMIRTLVEPKKKTISASREKLLSLGFEEEVEYDAINVEPVIVYSKKSRRRVFLKHKWECAFYLLTYSPEEKNSILKLLRLEDVVPSFSQEEDGLLWFKFLLVGQEDQAFRALASVMQFEK